jgi:hypothetical protein
MTKTQTRDIAKLIFFNQQINKAEKHMEAAIEYAVGFREAGFPDSDQTDKGYFSRRAGVMREVPPSWHHAYRCRLNYSILQSYAREWQNAVTRKDRPKAKRMFYFFNETYKHILEHAEETLASV